MSDHDLTVISTQLGARVQGICRCGGWISPWSSSPDAVEALHDAHVELAEPIPPEFSDQP